VADLTQGQIAVRMGPNKECSFCKQNLPVLQAYITAPFQPWGKQCWRQTSSKQLFRYVCCVKT